MFAAKRRGVAPKREAEEIPSERSQHPGKATAELVRLPRGNREGLDAPTVRIEKHRTEVPALARQEDFDAVIGDAP